MEELYPFMNEPNNIAGQKTVRDREDVVLKKSNLEKTNKWINRDEVLRLNAFDFLMNAQRLAVKGSNISPGIRPEGLSTKIVNQDRVRHIAPSTSITKLTEKLASKIDELISNSCVDAEALKVWVTTALIAIHPFLDGNGRASRALMGYVDRKRGMKNVSIPDSSENFHRFQDAHEQGISMATRMYVRNKYPDIKFPKEVIISNTGKSHHVKALEYLAGLSNRSYDQEVVGMISYMIYSVTAKNINTHPIVQEAENISDTLRFDRINIYRKHKEQGIATFPIK